MAKLNQALAHGGRSLQRDDRTGYLRPVLEALGVPIDSQLLVFSKTGVQRAYTSPHNPRALYFDPSVAVAYVPGAPLLEVAAHDPQQGVVFYALDQTAASPLFVRQRSCLTCHVAASTLDVPGMIARSYGRVVNVSSGAGQLSSMTTYAPAYSISKAALNALTIQLAASTKGRGVLVNCVNPGWVRTRMGGRGAPRSVEEGADTIVWLATLPANGPTGKFFSDRRAIDW